MRMTSVSRVINSFIKHIPFCSSTVQKPLRENAASCYAVFRKIGLRRRVAPVLGQAYLSVGAPGPSPLGTGEVSHPFRKEREMDGARKVCWSTR